MCQNIFQIFLHLLTRSSFEARCRLRQDFYRRGWKWSAIPWILFRNIRTSSQKIAPLENKHRSYILPVRVWVGIHEQQLSHKRARGRGSSVSNVQDLLTRQIINAQTINENEEYIFAKKKGFRAKRNFAISVGWKRYNSSYFIQNHTLFPLLPNLRAG